MDMAIDMFILTAHADWQLACLKILGRPKSLQMVIAAMKLKDVYSLEGKLWPT